MPIRKRQYRVVVATPHGHQAAHQGLSTVLRDAGLEVVTAGAVPSAAHVAAVAVQEDARAVALGVPAHHQFVAEVADALVAWGAHDVAVFAGTDENDPKFRGVVAQLHQLFNPSDAALSPAQH